LKPTCDEPLSYFAFKFDLRHYLLARNTAKAKAEAAQTKYDAGLIKTFNRQA